GSNPCARRSSGRALSPVRSCPAADNWPTPEARVFVPESYVRLKSCERNNVVRFCPFNAISTGGRIMQKAIIAGALAIVMAAIASFAAGGAKMKVTSSAFQEGANIPSKFTCDGANTSPPLQISDVPSEAKSLVLIVDDPDAPSGLFTHWVVWNLSAQATTIAEGSTPKGVQGTNDFGKSGYGGPCPPSGAHRYYFRVFALDRELDLHSGAKRSQLDAAMKGHVIAQ